MKQVFDSFAALLRRRFSTSIVTTEDSIRYTFFAALLDAGLKPHQTIQELPHPVIDRKEIDTWIPDYEGSEYFIEFKFDRVPSSGLTQNKTDRSGKLLNDMLRLAMVPSGVDKARRRLFVYLTDGGMHTYFTNPNNGYVSIYDAECNQPKEISEQFITTRPKSAQKSISCEIFPMRVTLLYKVAVNQEIQLRIFLTEKNIEPSTEGDGLKTAP